MWNLWISGTQLQLYFVIGFSIFFGKKEYQEKEDALNIMLTIWISNASIGGMPFLFSKNTLYL
jgi:hypothetical protein